METVAEIPMHLNTPLIESVPLSAIIGAPVYLKMDALQPSGSFKLRGIGRLCRQAYAEGAKLIVASSGGNAGYAAAYAARKLGLPSTIVVPKTTPKFMQETIARLGAKVIEHGGVWDEAHRFALDLAEKQSGAYIHPFDHPTIWDGHSTLIDEVVDEIRSIGTVVTVVGGGGLLCGIVRGLQRAGLRSVPILAVETEGAASFNAAVKAGKLVTLDQIDSVATTLGAKRVAAEALAYTKQHPITPWIVSDLDAVRACLRFLDDHRVLVEPSCGAGLSAVYKRAVPILEKGPVLVVVCGGIGATVEKLKEWERALSGR